VLARILGDGVKMELDWYSKGMPFFFLPKMVGRHLLRFDETVLFFFFFFSSGKKKRKKKSGGVGRPKKLSQSQIFLNKK
jgi:hypothetical protein